MAQPTRRSWAAIASSASIAKPSATPPLAPATPIKGTTTIVASVPGSGSKTQESATSTPAKASSPMLKGAAAKRARLAQAYQLAASRLKDLTGVINTPVNIPVRQLVNRGNTCFVNAALQVVLHCQPLASLLTLIAKHEDVLATLTPVTVSVARLLRDFGRGFGPLAPKHVDSAAEAMGPRGIQHDAQEFADHILWKMHEELHALPQALQKATDVAVSASQADLAELGITPASPAGVVEETVIQSSDDLATTAADSDGAEPADDGWEEVGRAGKSHVVLQRAQDFDHSPISDIFGGVVQALVKRSGSRATASATPFFWLPLDLGDESVNDLQSAFVASLHGEGVHGEKASRASELTMLPRILLLHLKRFEFDSRLGYARKVHKSVAFSESLVIPQRFAPTASAAARKYNLLGVVHHLGVDVASGHYVADVKTADGWMHCDDVRVSSLRSPIAEENYVTAYLLAYERA
eukprot:TRINITY_DN3521_c0_g1_i1.p1 TRINITY_DN3521_c0_g1~~TRINITY_DN3521_c0_g1_i1.p1  ORF type:complete len:467 (-),score=105.20 TRINITY_DN3521_c0_g1_i1:26-1426(-)